MCHTMAAPPIDCRNGVTTGAAPMSFREPSSRSQLPVFSRTVFSSKPLAVTTGATNSRGASVGLISRSIRPAGQLESWRGSGFDRRVFPHCHRASHFPVKAHDAVRQGASDRRRLLPAPTGGCFGVGYRRPIRFSSPITSAQPPPTFQASASSWPIRRVPIWRRRFWPKSRKANRRKTSTVRSISAVG